ncbi:YraN family protein [Fodinicola feengrottensis]|nr:YraN family protein [Fodinicola feengrottensis]
MGISNAVGRFGEEVAVRHLRESGMAVEDRNWRCRAGEIDVVARDGDALVFCEVKTRRGTRFGRPAEAVSPEKANRLRKLAGMWLADSGKHAPTLRFDVVEVLLSTTLGTQVEHLRGVL